MKKKQLQITLKRSWIATPETQTLTAKGLGLTRRGKTVIKENTPVIRGMVKKIIHMVDVKEI